MKAPESTQSAAGISARIAEKLAANPDIKTIYLAESLGIAEPDVFRHWPVAGGVAELDPARIDAAIHALERFGVIYLVVRTPAIVSESWGAFGGFSRSGPFLNVATEGLHLHIRTGEIASGFAIRREGRTSDAHGLSIQFFDTRGHAAFKVFLLRKPGASEGGPASVDFSGLFNAFATEFGKAQAPASA